MQLKAGYSANLVAGLLVGGERHQVKKDHVIHHVRDLLRVAVTVRRLPGGSEDGVEDFFQRGTFRSARVKFHQALGALRIEEELQRLLRGGFSGGQSVKRRAGVTLKM